MKKLVSLVLALSMVVTASVCGAAQETSVEPSSSVKISSVNKTGNKNKMNKKAVVATVVGSIVAAAVIATGAILIHGAVKDKKGVNVKHADSKSVKKSDNLNIGDIDDNSKQNPDNISKETIGNKTGKVLASIALIPNKAVKLSKEFVSQVKQGYCDVPEIKEQKEMKKALNVKKQNAEKVKEKSTVGNKFGKFFAAVTLAPANVFKATKGFISEVKQGYSDVPQIKLKREAAKNLKDKKETTNENSISGLEVNILEAQN